MSGKLKVSAIILSKNNGDTLERCIKSVLQSNGEKEIVIVDAHSTDETVQILQRYKDKIKIVYDKGEGIGIARNIGVYSSSGDIICFVDADAYVSKDHFIKIKDYFEKHPDVGVVHVQGKIRMTDNPTSIEKSAYIFHKSLSIKSHPYAGGYFLSFRREVFNEVGGFWEFPPYGADDLDFALRVMEKGWKRGFIETEGWHQPRRTLKGLWKEMWGWGKGKSCFDKKYCWHTYVSSLHTNRKIHRVLGKWYWLGNELLRLMAPIIAIKYVMKWRSLNVYLYFIVREWAHVLGYIWGMLTWARKVTLD